MPKGQPTERILYVDDSHLDRGLVRDALSADPNLRLTETTSRDEFEDKLNSTSFDIVLSDFNILGYDGLQVIASVQKSKPKVPVVIVTGTGSEEIAVEAMKLGAADYVIKSPSHIVRLPLTIRTVLEQTRLKSEEERLRTELELFFNMSHDLLLVLNSTGQIQRSNPTANAALELSPEELSGISFFDIIREEDVDPVKSTLGEIRASLQSARFLTCCQRANQSERWVEWSVFRSNGPNRLFAIGRDITERRAAEAEDRERAVARAKMSMLSPREQEVLKLVVAGKANKQSAYELDLSEKTIERHRSNGMRKLGLSSVPDLVRMAILAES